MKQATADLWKFPADARCITTNGATRQDGQAIMGRGVAAQAKAKWPMVAAVLGWQLRADGNHVHVVMAGAGDTAVLVAFPVKHRWQDPADLDLIKRSCGELMDLADRLDLRAIALVRPGCGNGRLAWAEVEPAIAPLLDGRVTIVHADVEMEY